MGFLFSAADVAAVTDPGVSPIDQVLCAAIHEAGHGIAFKKAGVRVLELRVTETREGYGNGVCQVDWDHIPDLRKYLVALLAGAESEVRYLCKYWGHNRGSALRELGNGPASDLEEFHKLAAGKFRESTIRQEARSFTWWHWGRIERLAAKLARKRYLRGSAV